MREETNDTTPSSSQVSILEESVKTTSLEMESTIVLKNKALFETIHQNAIWLFPVAMIKKYDDNEPLIMTRVDDIIWQR